MLKEAPEPSSPKNVRPIWEIITEIANQAPPGTWDDVPTDGSVNHDHYLYGAPQKEFVKPIFADTVYWVALIDLAWRSTAKRLRPPAQRCRRGYPGITDEDK
jgi:hypothetical protein